MLLHLALRLLERMRRHGESTSKVPGKIEPSSNLYRCGKNYQQGQPVLPPKGAFRHENRRQPVFRCLPRVRPYLPSDGCSSASFLIEYTPPAGSDDSATVDPLAATPSTLTLTVVGEKLRKVYNNMV